MLTDGCCNITENIAQKLLEALRRQWFPKLVTSATDSIEVISEFCLEGCVEAKFKTFETWSGMR